MDYSRAPCLGADQTTRGLWERDCSDWFWSQSIVFKKQFKTGMSLDLARGPDFSMTRGTPGDGG